jgi:hypothetical protein
MVVKEPIMSAPRTIGIPAAALAVTFVVLAIATHAQTPIESAHYAHDGKAVLPDPTATPGAVLTTDKAKICTVGYAKTVPEVAQSDKDRVFAMYSVKPSTRTVNGKVIPVCCQVDRLISAKLGGSNDIKNLWPEPYSPRPGAHEKDALEDWLLKQVCAGSIPVEQAQQGLAKDWYASYKQMK